LNLISVVQLGTVDYATGLRLQQQLIDLRKAEKIGDVLLLLEHSPVISAALNFLCATVVAMSLSMVPDRSSATQSLTYAVSPHPVADARLWVPSTSSDAWRRS
jgi:hypothetical protein